MATNRLCKNSADTFCYVCGEYISAKSVSYKIIMGNKFCLAYNAYFGMPIGDQDKSWAPHVSCGSCRSTLEGWYRGTTRKMSFAVPRIWREPQNHHDDCYFCMVDITKIKRGKGRRNIAYPDIPSSIAPVPHNEDLPIPVHSFDNQDLEMEQNLSSESEYTDHESTETSIPHFPIQSEIDDLVRDMALPKGKAEIMTSRLKQWNLLDPSVKISSYRNRHMRFSPFYEFCDSLLLCFCTDVSKLFNAMEIEYIPSDWRLFIDSSVKSLKAVLLHNGNVYPSIPVAHSVHLNENYENVKNVLTKINYKAHMWDVIGDFKMLAFLLGLQAGYTKFSCFLCLWDSRADMEHYNTHKEWPVRHTMEPGKLNILHNALVPRSKILLPPLHIKLGLVKQFIKALDSNSDAYLHIRSMFPKLSDAKVRAGIFVGPQIRRMFASKELEDKMTDLEKNAWNAFRQVVCGFLGNNRSENYTGLVENLMKHYELLGCRMSIKMHYLHSHLSFFKQNLGDVSEEHGERFHQDILTMEKRYQGHWNAKMMGDYIWNLIRDHPNEYRRKNLSNIHF